MKNCGKRSETAIVVDRSAIQRRLLKERHRALVHGGETADGVGRP